MKSLLLIPSVVKTEIEDKVMADKHPEMDYHALASALRAAGSGSADIIDYKAVENHSSAVVRLVHKLAGLDAGLALAGFLQRKRYDCIFTNGENVGIPLALLFKLSLRRPGHVTIGHRLSTGKKRLFFRTLRVHRQMDTIFVYATTQHQFGIESLQIPAKKLALIPFHADSHFYRPLPEVRVDDNQICSAGLEWRDYPTLIDAVAQMPDLTVKLAASSPWSKHNNETENRTLPANVDARRYEYCDLRDLYAGSSFVVVPLYENDFQAGVTTLLEGMAMGKAVIVTQTTGQTDVVENGVNGLIVIPGDISGLRAAIEKLRADHELRDRLSKNGRLWLEKHATLRRWVASVAGALEASAPGYSGTNSFAVSEQSSDLKA